MPAIVRFDEEHIYFPRSDLRKDVRYKQDPRFRLLKHTRRSARFSGLYHSLELEDIPLPKYCKYLSVKLSYDAEGPIDHRASVDRIDSSKGYTKGNIQVISYLANTMKNKATTKQLITFARNVLRAHLPSKAQLG